jgi:hypothetical protein
VGSFTIDLTRFGQKTENQMSKIVRKIVLDLHTRLVMRAPVDTGRFRANNSISLNTLPTGATLVLDPNGAGTIQVGQQVMAAFKLGDTIFLYNNVEYALALEYGHSKQAPAGVYRISVQDIVTHFGVAA